MKTATHPIQCEIWDVLIGPADYRSWDPESKTLWYR